jgi:hypothetical protein
LIMDEIRHEIGAVRRRSPRELNPAPGTFPVPGQAQPQQGYTNQPYAPGAPGYYQGYVPYPPPPGGVRVSN